MKPEVRREVKRQETEERKQARKGDSLTESSVVKGTLGAVGRSGHGHKVSTPSTSPVLHSVCRLSPRVLRASEKHTLFDTGPGPTPCGWLALSF